MKDLVKGQKIRIDNHHRGTRGIDYYDDPANDIHLDKTMYDGKKKKGVYQIQVPLNSSRPVTVNHDEEKEIPRRLLEEIQNEFADEEKRKRFVKEMSDVLNGYPIKDKNHANVDKVKTAMKKVADAFELGWDEGNVLNFVHSTATQGLTFISLLPRKECMYYLTINYVGIVVADFDRIPKRYVGEWEKI